MKKVENHLSQLDIKYITSILGRTPTEVEIQFIELVLRKKLENREYLQVVNRLNDGAKRNVKTKIEINEKSVMQVNNGIKIFDKDNSLLLNKDETHYINKINNIRTVINDIVIYSSDKQNVEKLLQKEVTHRKKSKTIGSRVIKEEDKEIIYSTVLGLENENDKDNIPKLNNSIIYKIDFGKRTFQKHITQLNKFIGEINKEEWFSFARSINWNGLAVALINLVRETNLGIKISNKGFIDSINLKTSDDKSLSIIIAVQLEDCKKLKSFCSPYNLKIDELGTFTKESTFQVKSNDNILINLPLSVFDLQYNVNTKHFAKPEIEEQIIKNISKIKKSTSLTNQLLNLLEIISKNDILKSNTSSKGKLAQNISSYGLESSENAIDSKIVLSNADKNHLIDISPRLSGLVSVANAVRRLSCTGATPKSVIIQNIFPKVNEKYLWKASELLQGQEEAVRELEVEIGNRSIDSFENYWHQNITAIGMRKQNSIEMDISFKHDGDFISLLGSHRGELNGSAYQRYVNGHEAYSLPSIDLRMEKRLQDVVMQGINTNLIQSATNVSTGGISIAVAKSLIASDANIGARIHLSRKLNDAELLFGETQGLVIVSLSEIDIMEFERICMTIGVPSTTIGRVTDNDLFTFNEAIKIKVDKLRGVL